MRRSNTHFLMGAHEQLLSTEMEKKGITRCIVLIVVAERVLRMVCVSIACPSIATIRMLP
jgi:hypothetical protein